MDIYGSNFEKKPVNLPTFKSRVQRGLSFTKYQQSTVKSSGYGGSWQPPKRAQTREKGGSYVQSRYGLASQGRTNTAGSEKARW